MEIEEIAGETETEVNEQVVFAIVEREVWSNGRIKKMIRKEMCSSDKIK